MLHKNVFKAHSLQNKALKMWKTNNTLFINNTRLNTAKQMTMEALPKTKFSEIYNLAIIVPTIKMNDDDDYAVVAAGKSPGSSHITLPM